MPYRLKPTNKKIVQILKQGRWTDKFTHNTINSAKKQLSILNKVKK